MTNQLLVPISESGSGYPVYFVPAAGSTALSLVHLGRLMASSRPFHSFDLTALTFDRSLPTDLKELALLCVSQIRTIQAQGPYYIGGYCWGGMLALAIAEQLEASGEAVPALVLVEALLLQRDGHSNSDKTEKQAALNIMGEQIRQSLARLTPSHAAEFGQLADRLIKIGFQYKVPALKSRIVLIRTSTHPVAAYRGWHRVGIEFEEHIVAGGSNAILSKAGVSELANKIDGALRGSPEP